MPKEHASSGSRGTPTRGRPKFKRHELSLAGGGSLVLSAGGSIDQLAADGTTIRSWAPDDEGWPDQALRFGVHPQGVTVTPDGRRRSEMRQPRP
jgi:hypothetical protein